MSFTCASERKPRRQHSWDVEFKVKVGFGEFRDLGFRFPIPRSKTGFGEFRVFGLRD